MTLLGNRYALLTLFTALLLLSVNFALSSEKKSPEEDTETATDEEEAEQDETEAVYKITIPVAHNPLPTDIIDSMRKKLMVVMGVEPEETEAAGKTKKAGH